jgi:hypothetical protein
MEKVKHFAKPVFLKLSNLCANKSFQKKINQLREKWGINDLAKSFEEANKFWQSLCEADRKKSNYHEKWYEGKTRDRRLKQDLEDSCRVYNIALDMWFVLYYILLCFNLDKVTEQDILQLPLHPSLARVAIAPYNLNPFQDNHLYLNVTFATRKDIEEIWPLVLYWQKNIRPSHIKNGLLPNLLEDINTGRTPVSEYTCLECAELKDKGWTYRQIGKHFEWPLQVSALNRHGKETKSRCRTAEEAVRRGRQLREIGGKGFT